jgi:hypothetical protein
MWRERYQDCKVDSIVFHFSDGCKQASRERKGDSLGSNLAEGDELFFFISAGGHAHTRLGSSGEDIWIGKPEEVITNNFSSCRGLSGLWSNLPTP